MIPEMELHFTSSLRLKCKSQVIYRQPIETPKKKSRIKCGLALLDMEPKDHIQLVSLLHQTENEHSYVCNKVDLDDLWDFFFETGFIYPNKYDFIRKNKQKIKETYEKLYTSNPTIARHFIYQENSRILGHMSMLRFYENTWLIQHHAARNADFNRAGLIVLSQMGRFGNASHRLYSVHMNYVICFYRPENKFPNRVFGGACSSIKNLKGCSEDLFAYYHFRQNAEQPAMFEGPGQWDFTAVQDGELFELEKFYEHASGGGFADNSISTGILSEGFSMLRTLISDFKDAGHTVTTTLDSRVAKLKPPILADCSVPISSTEEIPTALQELSEQADATYVIAPETDNLLKSLVELLEKTGIKSVGISGGVAYNERIVSVIKKSVESAGLNLIRNTKVPCGDAGVSVGQIAVSASRSL